MAWRSHLGGRLMRLVGRAFHRIRKNLTSRGIIHKVKPSARRLGVYVAYYDGSWIFEEHLESLKKLASGPFNYYVMANCTNAWERRQFEAIVRRHEFVNVFLPFPRRLILGHDESLQRMIDLTDDEVIVLCDIDAFPVRRGWDEYLLEQLTHRDIVSVVVDFPGRNLPVFLHPCFMAFRRSWMEQNRLDVRAGEGNDPAYKITQHLFSCGCMSEQHVTPLWPTGRERILYERGRNALFGHDNLRPGFGTTYGSVVFHFWFSRYIAQKRDVYEDLRGPLRAEEMQEVVRDVKTRLRRLLEGERPHWEG